MRCVLCGRSTSSRRGSCTSGMSLLRTVQFAATTWLRLKFNNIGNPIMVSQSRTKRLDVHAMSIIIMDNDDKKGIWIGSGKEEAFIGSRKRGIKSFITPPVTPGKTKYRPYDIMVLDSCCFKVFSWHHKPVRSRSVAWAHLALRLDVYRPRLKKMSGLLSANIHL